jgi:hypothetical protein
MKLSVACYRKSQVEMRAQLRFMAGRTIYDQEYISTSLRPWESIHNCVVMHPIHVELETTHSNI